MNVLMAIMLLLTVAAWITMGLVCTLMIGLSHDTAHLVTKNNWRFYGSILSGPLFFTYLYRKQYKEDIETYE